MRVWQRGSVKGTALTLLCLFFVLYPLFAGPGPVNTRGGGDSPFLLVRLEQMVAGLRSGAFPVRWMPDAAYGLGYPFFDFYAALPYYVAAFFRLSGWGAILSLQVTQALGFVLAAAAMALLARRVFRRPAAVALAAVAYTSAPFHLANVYVRGDSLSEFYAFIFYPLIAWALLGLRARPSLPNVGWLALSLGGLALTHNLSALMLVPFVAAGALLLLWPPAARAGGGKDGPHGRAFWQRIGWRKAGSMLGGAALGLALSASLWLAVLGDLKSVWMGVKDIQTRGFFSYEQHFRGRDLIQRSALFDYEGRSGGTPFAMGTVQAVVVLAGVAAWGVEQVRSGKRRQGELPALEAFWVGGLALSTLMITPASRLLWAHLPVLPIVQFPWRFLSVQAFFGALLIGGLAERLPRPWWVAAAGALLLTLGSVGDLHPEYLDIGEPDVTPERLALFESFTTNVGTTIRGEYLPAGVEPRPMASPTTIGREKSPEPMVLAGQVDAVALLGRDGRSQRWRVTVRSDQAHLAFYTLYFPGWKAYLADPAPVGSGARPGREQIPIEALPNSGLIALDLPRGEHVVLLVFGRTAVRWIADGLSAVGFLAVAASFWPWLRALTSGQRWRALAAVGGGALSIAAVVALGRLSFAAPPVQPAGDLTMDFDRAPYLHHNPQGVDFGRARLVSYAFEPVVRGGEVLAVTLTWAEPAPDLTADVRLVTPADPHPLLQPAPAPLAEASARIESATTMHALAVPADAASGPYYVQVRVLDGQDAVRAANARGDTLGPIYLRPVQIENPRPAQEGDPIAARFGDRILLRDDVQVEAQDGNWEIKLTWQATAPIPANYTCSLHVLSTDGRSLKQRDFAEGPGYGFWPTSAWPVGEWLTDRLRVPIPEEVRGEDAAALSVVLYDPSQPGLPAAGSAVVPLGQRVYRYEEPEMARRVGATFGGQIRLLGYDLEQKAQALRLVLHWQAVGQVSVDGVVFVHLFDPASERIVVQSDARPQRGTYPTRWWRAGEVVSEEVVLSLDDVPASYRLAVGIYDAGDRDRLPVVDAAGETLPDGRLILEDVVSVPSPGQPGS